MEFRHFKEMHTIIVALNCILSQTQWKYHLYQWTKYNWRNIWKSKRLFHRTNKKMKWRERERRCAIKAKLECIVCVCFRWCENQAVFHLKRYCINNIAFMRTLNQFLIIFSALYRENRANAKRKYCTPFVDCVCVFVSVVELWKAWTWKYSTRAFRATTTTTKIRKFIEVAWCECV